MKRLVRFMPVLGACALVCACASDHPANTTAAAARPVPPPAATPPATAPGGTAAAPTKTNRIVLEDKDLTNDEIRALFAQGYKPMSRDGKVYYCRQEMKTGSRFATRTCKTAEQMKQVTQDSKDLVNSTQRTGACRTNAAAC